MTLPQICHHFGLFGTYLFDVNHEETIISRLRSARRKRNLIEIQTTL